MNIYIMDSMYFDSVEKLLPAEFAKGYKILLFYEKGRKLPPYFCQSIISLCLFTVSRLQTMNRHFHLPAHYIRNLMPSVK